MNESALQALESHCLSLYSRSFHPLPTWHWRQFTYFHHPFMIYKTWLILIYCFSEDAWDSPYKLIRTVSDNMYMLMTAVVAAVVVAGSKHSTYGTLGRLIQWTCLKVVFVFLNLFSDCFVLIDCCHGHLVHQEYIKYLALVLK